MRDSLKIDRVRVLFHGVQVGMLAYTREGTLAFSYSSDWLKDGFSISPLSLPLENKVFTSDATPFEGLFGVFADSLPDGWGRLLVDRTLRKHGINPTEAGPLFRLSIVGSSGMGALEYLPETKMEHVLSISSFDEIAAECVAVLNSDATKGLDALFEMGGSSGGARPKVLVCIDGQEWIVKFPSHVDAPEIGKEEYEIAQLAKDCGIKMPQTKLFESAVCSGYFGVQRFDRLKGMNNCTIKKHMVSVAGLLEVTHRIPNLDYETLMKLTLHLTGDETQIEQLYLLMCFNVLIGNKDDHSKNFSFIFNENTRRWELSPAYDLTRNPGLYGEHATTVAGKGKDITIDDLISVGVGIGMDKRTVEMLYEKVYSCVKAGGYLIER